MDFAADCLTELAREPSVLFASELWVCEFVSELGLSRLGGQTARHCMRDRLFTLFTQRKQQLERGFFGLCLCAALLACSACGGAEASGPSQYTLVVQFQLGPGVSCDSLGVTEVRGELDGAAYVASSPCQGGQVRFQGIPSGTYAIQLFGLDADGYEILDSYDSVVESVMVGGSEETTVSPSVVVLTETPARLSVRWDFDYSSCADARIAEFEISVWVGAKLIIGQTLDCLLPADLPSGYRSIVDPDRRLSGSIAGEVTVQPFDLDGVDYGNAVLFKYRAPGPGRDIRLTVKCQDGACISETGGVPD
jgi:hypothetical protein